MIKINDEVVNIGSFPDGSMLVKHNPYIRDLRDLSTINFSEANIVWKYENDLEILAMVYLVKHLRTHGVEDIILYMPYIPNARQDRVKSPEDVFTLKYFAEILNGLNLTSVYVLDPHSTVSEALINNISIIAPREYIEHALEIIGVERFTRYDPMYIGEAPKEKFSLTMFYPDEGAMKRYSGMVKLPYAFGIKNRNWETGVIEGLDVAGGVDQIAGKDILIVDDICSRGGTFLHSAKKLKELGANDIYLYVSHCENTILEGELLTSGLIKKVFTTDSIFTKEHELIEVLK